MSIKGFDVHDAFGADPAWFQARKDEGYEFAIIKASGGYGFRNKIAGQQVAAARKAGLAVGFYHFMFEPDSPMGHGGADWKREAQNFIAAVEAAGGQAGDTLWLDVEAWGYLVGFNGSISDWCVNFCEYVSAHFRTVCGIYCATWYLVPTGMATDQRLRKYPLWFASWQAELPWAWAFSPWDAVTVWQYNADELDKDLFFGTVEGFKAMGIGSADLGKQSRNEIRTGILEDGRPYVQVVFDGVTTRVDGAEVADLGIAVESATEPGLLLDQSVQQNVFGGWRERR